MLIGDHVKAPEEAEYADLARVMSYLQSVIETPIAATSTDISTALETIWGKYDERQRGLISLVRPSMRSIEHKFVGTVAEDVSNRRHWIFHAYLTSFSPNDPRELIRGLDRQIALLRTINRLHRYNIDLSYRLYTIRTAAEDLEAVFELTCTVNDCDAATAESLRDSLGELVHSAYVGIYGINFSFETSPLLKMPKID